MKKLVKANTTLANGELAAARVISEEFERCGIKTDIDVWDDNRANILAHINSEKLKPALLFVGHLDVIPTGSQNWQFPPFDAVEQDDKIFGRGTTDMKGGLASLVTAIREVLNSGTKLKGDIIVLACAGEEIDSCGAIRFMEQHKDKLPPLAGIIVPEPTDFDIITAHHGIFWLEITTHGKSAHGSSPGLGRNAITMMKNVLDELEDYKPKFKPHRLLKNCSISINTIAGGHAVNVVPDRCTIQIDIRTLPYQDHEQIIDDFKKIFRKIKNKNRNFSADISVIRVVPALETDHDCEFTKTFCSAVGCSKTKPIGFCTDGPFFAPLAAPIIIFGPGKPQLCHKPDEYIDIPDLYKAVEYYRNIILKFLT